MSRCAVLSLIQRQRILVSYEPSSTRSDAKFIIARCAAERVYGETALTVGSERRVDIDSADSFNMRIFHATLRLISVQ